jgi:phage tail tape-measure protein
MTFRQEGSAMKWVGSRLVTWVSLISVTLAMSGCASSPVAQPSTYAYPQKGQTADKQAQDTTECQGWAKQQTGFDPLTDSAKGAGVGALVGALGGAAAGAAIGAATGHAGTGAAIGAAAGGVGGAGVGGTYNYSKSKEGYDRAFAACMSSRAYIVR